MSTISLCREDPLLSLVYDLFGANIVRVPDARVQPMAVVAHRSGRSFFRGSLLPLLSNPSPLGVLPTRSLLTDISGRRSRRVTAELGVHILRGFLKGFGLPTADLTGSLESATSISFAFPSVHRIAVDVNALGWAIAGRHIDRGNPAAAILFEQPRYELLLIDSILTSRQIAVVVSGERNRGLNVDLSVIRQIVAELGGQVGASGAGQVELILESAEELTFAFSCVRLQLEPDGLISALPPDHRRRTLGEGDLTAPLTVDHPPHRVLLSPGPAFLVWDR